MPPQSPGRSAHTAVPPLRVLVGRRIAWGLAAARGPLRKGRSWPQEL